jgi:hypothetical protein
MARGATYRPSSLDGTEPGGFIVLNVNAPMLNPYQVVEDDAGNAYFPTLQGARALCRRLRREAGNPDLYVYGLFGVKEAIGTHPDIFPTRR